jgi:uncharacterized protein YbaR (Trm112 family)
MTICGEMPMKKLLKLLIFAALAVGVIYAIKKLMSSPVDDFSTGGSGVLPSEPVKSLDEAPLGGEISQELLDILVCPEDKGPLELTEDGKFLLNPRNGYRYPIRNGIPVMLIEEGKKYQISVDVPESDEISDVASAESTKEPTEVDPSEESTEEAE